MRIVQIIDSLEAGGAERMAVNYANELSAQIAFSGLVCSRAEGSLKEFINPKVNFLFLERKRTLDLKAIFRLRKFCIDNKIDFVHAHSSSYFLATLVKLTYPKLKIVWHDHNGMSEFLNSRESAMIKHASRFFRGIIVVNNNLKMWAASKLHCKEVLYLPNFTAVDQNQERSTVLHGSQGKRILCLANLRSQKNHLMLLQIAEKLQHTHPEWTFHLVGKDFQDDYSTEIKRQIRSLNLQQAVFLYDSRTDISAIISQADIAILTSSSEGLPVALLEYGLHQKPIVVTTVGEIPQIITNGVDGLMVAPDDPNGFYNSLTTLIENPDLRQKYASALKQTIMRNNFGSNVISQYLNWIDNL